MILLRSRFARRLLIGALASLGVLAAADTGLWFFATARLAHELAILQGRGRAAGWTLSAGPPQRAGWPFAAAIVLPDAGLAGGTNDLPGGLFWQAERAALSLALLPPWRLTLRVTGPQRLRLATLAEFGFTADRFELVLPFATLRSGARARMADVAVAGLSATLPTGELSVSAIALHADTRPVEGSGETALTLTGRAEAIDLPLLPGGRPWPPGPHIAAASFDAVATGPVPRPGSLAARAAAWRDGGGTLLVRHLELGWGKLGLTGSATMALDGRLQPVGTAMVTLTGYDAPLEALASSGLLAPRAVQAIKGVLGILVRPSPDGGARQVDLPVTLRDRVLAVGPFPLLRLPESGWH